MIYDNVRFLEKNRPELRPLKQYALRKGLNGGLRIMRIKSLAAALKALILTNKYNRANSSQ